MFHLKDTGICFIEMLIWQCIGVMSDSINLSPGPIASVVENTPLELTAVYNGTNNPLIITWTEKKDNTVIDLKSINVPPFCEPFSLEINISLFQYSCTNTFVFGLTIRNVTAEQHNNVWHLSIIDTKGKLHNSTTILFVQVPVRHVSFMNSTQSPLYVKENEMTNLVCITSEERPRSTVKLYMSNGVILTGLVVPSDKNSLARTVSTFSYNFSRENSGTRLHCEAANINGKGPTSSNEVDIYVAYRTEGPPVIVNYSNGSTFKAILSEPQMLKCYIKGGSPKPSLNWNCLNGSVTSETGNENEVRKIVNWTPIIMGKATCSCNSQQKVFGEQSSILHVDVLYPPSQPLLTSDSMNITGNVKAIQDKRLKVTCISSGNPNPSYKWHYNAAKFGNSTPSINFERIKKSDTGEYLCTATNMMVASNGGKQNGTSSSLFTLIVLFPPVHPKFKIGSQSVSGNIYVVQGDRVEVLCLAESNPGPLSYNWTGQFGVDGLLQINSIESTTVELCTATNYMVPTFGSAVIGSASASLSITVLKKPSVPLLRYVKSDRKTIDTETLVVINATTFSVECYGSNSLPEPTSYSWLGPKSSSDAFLRFYANDSQSSGNYTCRVSNIMVRTVGGNETGENRKQLNIVVHYPPLIDHLQDEVVVEDERLNLICSAKSKPQPDYEWKRLKDNKQQNSSTWTIDHVKRADAGEYQCSAYNLMTPTFPVGNEKGEDTKTLIVTVLYPPDVHVDAENTTANQTQTEINCTASGVPANYSFTTWTQTWPGTEKLIRKLNSTDHSISSKRRLQLTSLTYQDTGIYTCGASNGIKGFTMTSSVYLLVKSKPVVIPKIPDKKVEKVPASLKKRLRINITVYSNVGEISASLYRLSDNEKVFVNASLEIKDEPNVKLSVYGSHVRTIGYSVFISHIIWSVKDFGLYYIGVTNAVGTTVHELDILPEGPPCTPKNLTLAEVSSTSVTILWVSCFHGGKPQTFVIQLSKDGRLWSNSSLIDGGLNDNEEMLNTTLKGLQSNSLYHLRIFSVNELGSSNVTEVLNVTTGKNEPTIEKSSLIGVGIGSGVGAAIVVVAVIGFVVLFKRRRQQKEKEDDSKKTILASKRSSASRDNDATAEIKLNPMYESSDTVQQQTGSNADVYAKVNKPFRPSNPGACSDVYSVVNKAKEKDTKWTKAKNSKKGEGKKQQKKSKQVEVAVYENAETTACKVKDADNVYENPVCSASDEKPCRMKNEDGLIYIEIDLPQQRDGQNKQPVIHGDDRTVYADVAYGLVGEPRPESDEEEK